MSAVPAAPRLLGVRRQPHREHLGDRGGVAIFAHAGDEQVLARHVDPGDAVDDERLGAKPQVHGDQVPGRAREDLAVARQAKTGEQIHELRSLHGARLLRLAALGLLLATACAHRGASGSAQPTAAVRAQIDHAERAELARDHLAARRHYQAAVALAAAAGDTAGGRLAGREFAETLVSWGELGAAVRELERVVAASPDDAATWHDLGIIRHGQGDVAGATVALTRAKQLAPGDARPRIALGALHWKHGDRAAARREYQELLALDLPARVRDKVQWALTQLARPGDEGATARPSSGPSAR